MSATCPSLESDDMERWREEKEETYRDDLIAGRGTSNISDHRVIRNLSRLEIGLEAEEGRNGGVTG